MKYYAPIITPPIKWGENFECDIRALGDSIFITPLTTIDTTLKFEEPTPTSVTIKPCVSLVEAHNNVIGVVTEGETLGVTVRLSEPSTSPIVVTVVADTTGIAEVTNENRASKDVESIEDTVDYVTEFFSPASVGDYTTDTIQITIPAGDTEATGSFSTNDDAIFTGGKGYYRVGTMSITAQDNVDYMIHPQKNRGLVFIEDSTEAPKFTGKLQVWCRMSELGEYEPVLDPETSSTVEMVYDWVLADDGITVENWAGSSKIIDDVPIQTLLFKFLPDELPEDINQTSPEDLTGNPPLIRFQVICGRRE